MAHPSDGSSAGGGRDDDAQADQATILESSGGDGQPAGVADSTLLELDRLGRAKRRSGGGDGDVQASPPTATKDRYTSVRVLGEGGMGKVFLAEDRDLKRSVAIKVMVGDGLESKARFLEEAQVMGQLDHPNILSVHELGLSPDDRLYYTMPVVEGQTLHEILDGVGRADEALARTYTLTRLVQIVQQLAQAMAYAHEKGVIHRDLKPMNVMIGSHGEVLVLDWGLAKVVEKGRVDTDRLEALTRMGQLMGTPVYMSPEQASGQEAGCPSDIYSLGVILYEALTLTVPFDGPLGEILSGHLTKEPEAPRERAPERGVPARLEAVCLRALQKDPADRYASVREMHDEIQGWLEGELDRADSHSQAERRVAVAGKKLRRYLELKAAIERLEIDRIRLERQIAPWQPLADKRDLLAAEEQLATARRQLLEHACDVEATLMEAIGIEREHPRARQLLTEYYVDRHQDAESVADERSMGLFAALVRRYDDGRYAHEFAAPEAGSA